MTTFDPKTGLPVRVGPPPINTRTTLFHKTRATITVEGRGANDAEKRADVAAQVAAKQKEGYSLTRFDGQHPHSFDDHRMQLQQRQADAGDKDARAALEAKAKLSSTPATSTPSLDEVAQLRAQVAAMQAKFEELTAPAAASDKGGKDKG